MKQVKEIAGIEQATATVGREMVEGVAGIALVRPTLEGR